MTKAYSLLGTLFTLFFTSVLAPVMIHILTEAHDRKVEPDQTVKTTRPPNPEERLIVQGQGASPEEAWYNAQANALRAAVTKMVDAQTLANDHKLICAAVFRDTGWLITRCQDLGCSCEQGVWRREVVVFIARANLVDRLRGAHVRVLDDVVR